MQDDTNTENTNPNTETGKQNLPETPVTEPSTPTPDIAQATNDNPGVLAVPPQTPKKKSKTGLLIAVIILLLAIGGATLWYLQNKSNSSKQTNKVKETQDIAELKIGSSEGPASVYFPDEGLTGPQTLLDHQIYEGLVGIENNKPVPFIAQSWTNPDENTWVFKIRPNVKFHTGKAVTAKEVKAALDSLSKYEYWSIFTTTIISTEATGDLELTIKTKTPDALLLNRLAQAYITDLTASDKAGNNGTGAYQVDSSVTNDEKSTTLVAFDGHYAGRVKTRKLVLTIYENDEAVATALKNNEINIGGTLPIPAIKSDLEKAGFKSNNYDSPGTFGLYMNLVRKNGAIIMSNKDFRKAIALAIDRKGLIEKAGNNNQAATQIIPKSLPGYDASISLPAFDLTEAKAALIKSGYNNQPLEFAYVKEVQIDAPILIAQLKALGINIKEVAFEQDNIAGAAKTVRAGDYDFFTAGYTSDISDARDLLGRTLGSNESTYPTIKDEAFDKLLADSDKAFDATERIKLLQKANKYIADNLLWIPLRGAVYSTYYPKDIDLEIEFNGTGMPGVYFRKVGRIVN